MEIPAYIAIPLVGLIVYLFVKWLRKFLFGELWHARYDKDANFKSPAPAGEIEGKIQEYKIREYLINKGELPPNADPRPCKSSDYVDPHDYLTSDILP